MKRRSYTDLFTTFKIIKIIDEYRVIINAGTEDDIKQGDILQICAPDEPVVDPDTGRTLGILSCVKATIMATEVYDRFSICQNQMREILSIEAFAAAFKPKTAQLRVDATQITGGYDKTIHIGDIVKRTEYYEDLSESSSADKPDTADAPNA